jgi:hypothetical protein
MKQKQKGEAMVVMMVAMLAIWLTVGHGHMGTMGHTETLAQAPEKTAPPPTASGTQTVNSSTVR